MPTTSEVLSPIKIANSSFIGSPNSLPSPEATLKELKAFIIKNDLDVKCNTGGASRRTKSDIYRDLCRALEKKCKSVESPNVEESPKAMREPSERKVIRQKNQTRKETVRLLTTKTSPFLGQPH